MTVRADDYVISGGAGGKSRLNMLGSILEPYTRLLLTNLGLGQGNSFLDNGSGGGNVSIMAAKIVGKTGRVTGIDFDEDIIRLAEEDRLKAKQENLEYKVQYVYDLEFNEAFDFCYARFLLSHLAEPLKALDRMYRATKPGGMIVVEDVQFSGHFCYPANPAFDRYLELYTEVVKRNGGDAELGPKLPGLLQQLRLSDTGFDMVQPCFRNSEGKWMAYITLDRIRGSIIKAELAGEQEVDELLRELSIFTSREDTIISLPRIFRAWGTRPSGESAI